MLIEGRTLHARAANGAAAIPAVLAALEAVGVRAATVTLARPSLDDVYLRHAGRAYARMTPVRQTWQVTLRYVRVLLRQPAFVRHHARAAADLAAAVRRAVQGRHADPGLRRDLTTSTT